MAYYHCSPIPDLKVLQPGKPAAFDKPAKVYMTTLLPMALMYAVQNYEYTYGYNQEGKIHFDEYFPDELEILYRGKRASLYICGPQETQTTKIPNEVTSDQPVAVIREIKIDDAAEALLEQERMGNLIIRRHHQLVEKHLQWIKKVEADCIRKADLLNNPGPKADYYREHYPESWKLIQEEDNRREAGDQYAES